MTFSQWERWGPLAGVLAVACWIVAFIVGTSSPDSNSSDAKISAFYTSHSHQVRDMAVFFIIVAGVLFFLGFLAALRGRLIDAEGSPGRLTALAFGAGIASAALLVVAVIVGSSFAFTANDTDKFQLDPNTYRLVNDLTYSGLVAAVMVGAVLVWATSAIALRSGLLPRWLAWLSILAGILQLLAIFFIPLFIFLGWILFTSLSLFLRAHPRTPTQTI